MMEVARGEPIVLHGLEGQASCRFIPAPPFTLAADTRSVRLVRQDQGRR